MKILWLTIDRSQRVADIFGPLQRAVGVCEGVEVDYIARSDWSRETIMGHESNTPMVDPESTWKYDLIFSDAIFAYMDEDWANIKVPKVALFEDLHGPLVQRYLHKTVYGFDFNMILTRYRDAFGKMHPKVKKDIPVGWLPHCVDTATFKDYGQKKDIGLLSVGRMDSMIYPFRHQVHQACKGEAWYKRIGRPPEGKGEKWPVGADYARLLNRAHITASCASVYGYPVLKTLEIPACGSVLFTDHWSLEMADLGFVNNENFILKNPEYPVLYHARMVMKMWEVERLQRIAQNGLNLIQSRHTAEARANDFLQMMKGFLNGQPSEFQPLAHA